MHADHCIETLRIALMCHGDTTPVGLVKLDETVQLGGRADFSSLRKCVNFDKLVEFVESGAM